MDEMMTSILEAAALANHCYDDDDKDRIFKVTSKQNGAAINSGWAYYDDVDINMIPSNYFFARLYVKFNEHKACEAMMAIRGTNNLDNIEVDFKTWLHDAIRDGEDDNLPAYLNPAIKFYQACQAYLEQNFENVNTLKLTGHSLGGGIAKLICLIHQATPTIAFNSPGCGHLPEVNLAHASHIHNINAHYGLLNKIGFTVGKINMIEIPEGEANAKKIFTAFDEQRKTDAKADAYFRQAHQDKHPLLSRLAYALGLEARAKAYLAAGLKEQDTMPKHILETTLDIATEFHILQAYINLAYKSHGILSLIEDAYAFAEQHSINNMIKTLQRN